MYIDRIRINWDKVSPDSYLTRIPAIGLLQDLAFRKPVTFFVGENGTGKSTLLEAIAIAYGFNPEGGTLNYSFSTHNDYSELCDALTIAQGAAKGRRADDFYFSGFTDYDRVRFRREMLETDAEGLAYQCDALERMVENGNICVSGPREVLENCAELTIVDL